MQLKPVYAALLSCAVAALSFAACGSQQLPEEQLPEGQTPGQQTETQQESLSGEGASDGGASAVLSIDCADMAEALRSQLGFQDEMSAVEPVVFYALYALEEGTADSGAMIASTGATAEEIAVIHAASAEAVSVVEDAVAGRIQSQRDGFEDYVPAELDKLSQPVIVTSGQYVVCVVSDDNDAAKSAIETYLLQSAQ